MIEIKRMFKVIGDFDVDFHYLIRQSGLVEPGRDSNVWAGHRCKFAPDKTVWVVIETDNIADPYMTEAQKKALEWLHDLYPDTIVDVEDKEEVE